MIHSTTYNLNLVLDSKDFRDLLTLHNKPTIELQGATIVKLVNASQAGAAGMAAGQATKIVTGVKTLGTNVVTVAGKPIQQTAQLQGTPGKQTIVINKPGGVATAAAAAATAGATIKGAQGQQIIVVTTTGGLKPVQGVTTTQAATLAGMMKL